VKTGPLGALLAFLYGEERAESLLSRLYGILGSARSGGGKEVLDPAEGLIGCGDALLISYGDMLGAEAGNESGESGLGRLFRFLEKRNRGAFTWLHILPFHPYSSDDGFSVIDYRKVDPRFGSWEDLEKLKTLNLNLAFDFVINHGSVQSEWFREFLEEKENRRNWYIRRPASYDYSSVVRPRTHPLLTPFAGGRGKEPVYVWTTFSADQADYDFSNPEVLLEFVRILLEYTKRGAGIVRLDAIAYLWKEDGSPCLHHAKTHGVVKLFRAVVDHLRLPLLLLTETNVPHGENISYFGSPLGDPALDSLPEAHMVYNFALPPLTLYAALSGDAGPLRNWAKTLPAGPVLENAGSPPRYFLNFLASHDGVGLTPARGLVDDQAFNAVIEEAKRRGALVSYKSSPRGDIPYELNCSYAAVIAPQNMGDSALRARAFLAVHGVLFSLAGLPAVYFHSWTGSEAWTEGPSVLGYNRAINREKPVLDRVEQELKDPRSFRFHVYRGFAELLGFRQEERAFDPLVPQYVFDSPEEGGKSIFALIRGPSKEGRWVLCIENLGGAKALWKAPGERPDLPEPFRRQGIVPLEWKEIVLEPWECLWLVFSEGALFSRLSTIPGLP
jgi:sucrose phosphorylase